MTALGHVASIWVIAPHKARSYLGTSWNVGRLLIGPFQRECSNTKSEGKCILFFVFNKHRFAALKPLVFCNIFTKNRKDPDINLK